jgi:hypothetical protein
MRIITLVILAAVYAGVGRAEIGMNYRSKLGFDLKALKTNQDREMGWLGGIRAARFFGTSNVFMGVTGFFGAPTGDGVDEQYMAYGGLLVGMDGRMSRTFTFEVSFASGIGEGKFKARDPMVYEKSHFVFEPSASVGVGLDGGWRLSFAVSYLHLPDANHFSGPTMGLRFEHRSSTAIREIND